MEGRISCRSRGVSLLSCRGWEEQLAVLGIECLPELCWNEWRTGDELKKHVIVKNVGLKPAVVCYKPPQNRSFSLPLPEARKVPPGITWAIPVTFRPQTDEPAEDELEIFTDNGSLKILLKAKGSEAAICIPDAIAFGDVAVGREQEEDLAVKNTGSVPMLVRWRVSAPFTIRPASFELPLATSLTCRLSFKPSAPCTYSAAAVCELVVPSEDGMPTRSRPIRKKFELPNWESCPAEAPEALASLQEATTGQHVLQELAFSGQVVKTYQMQIKGSGKIPYLLIGGKTEETVDFGTLLPGEAQARTLTITNTTPVLAEFTVCNPQIPNC